jgi:hypothetical protein
MKYHKTLIESANLILASHKTFCFHYHVLYSSFPHIANKNIQVKYTELKGI